MILVFFGGIATTMLGYGAYITLKEYYVWNTVEEPPSYWVLLLFVSTMFVGLFANLLLCAHAFLISVNVTTKEFFAFKIGNPGSGIKMPTKFNTGGILSNWIQVMGPDMLMWWNPWQDPFNLLQFPNAGYTFPMAKE